MDKMLRSAIEVLERINYASYEAYIIGGFTRDFLLNKPSKDIDITTSATPDVIEKLFPDHFNKSMKYRTITVRHNGFEFEVTTFRKDTSYSDHRHPRTKYAKDLIEDVKRRDFTINALALDKNLDVKDLVNGTKDLNDKIIRAIGSPTKRFNEDALRMFRAFRFASRFFFTIEPKTLDAIRRESHLTQHLSKERVRAELEQIVGEEFFFDYINQMLNTRILRYYPSIEKSLKFLYQNYRQVNILELISISMFITNSNVSPILVSKKEERTIEDILGLLHLIKDRNISKYSIFEVNNDTIKSAVKISEILKFNCYTYDEIITLKGSIKIKSIKDLAINGDDIKNHFNLPNSPLIGEYLNKALLLVLYDNCKNIKEDILKALE